MVNELRKDRPSGRAVAVVHLDRTGRIVRRCDLESACASLGCDGGKLIELMSLVTLDASPDELAGEKPNVPLLGTHEVLQRAI